MSEWNERGSEGCKKLQDFLFSNKQQQKNREERPFEMVPVEGTRGERRKKIVENEKLNKVELC